MVGQGTGLSELQPSCWKQLGQGTGIPPAAVSSREPPTPVSPASAPVPGVPEADQQLAGGLQHAGALRHSVAGPIRKPGGHER